jgi:translation initiation factor IF-3
LLDHSGSVIGVYTASEARKKAEALNLDMVMVSLNTSPITCKAVDFRKRILNRFYDQIVVKSNKLSNEELI